VVGVEVVVVAVVPVGSGTVALSVEVVVPVPVVTGAADVVVVGSGVVGNDVVPVGSGVVGVVEGPDGLVRGFGWVTVVPRRGAQAALLADTRRWRSVVARSSGLVSTVALPPVRPAPLVRVVPPAFPVPLPDVAVPDFVVPDVVVADGTVVAAVVVAVVVALCAAVSAACAATRFASATDTDRLRSLGSIVASTWPLVTRSPTATLTDVTRPAVGKDSDSSSTRRTVPTSVVVCVTSPRPTRAVTRSTGPASVARLTAR
jgi:hypothetical protein